MPAGIAAPLLLSLTAASTAVGIAGAAGAFGKPKAPSMPPVPFAAQQQDQSVQKAEQNQLQRQEEAGGVQSTIGTPTAAGAILNPANSQSKALLGS